MSGKQLMRMEEVQLGGHETQGTVLMTVGKLLLWTRPLDALAAVPLPESEDARFPFWSPDSRFIGYFTEMKLMKIDATGGPGAVKAAYSSGKPALGVGSPASTGAREGDGSPPRRAATRIASSAPISEDNGRGNGREVGLIDAFPHFGACPWLKCPSIPTMRIPGEASLP